MVQQVISFLAHEVQNAPAMKMIYVFLLAITGIFASCEKTSDSAAGSFSLSGRWQVITDSSGVGTGVNNHIAVFEGGQEDYFDFGADSILTVKEGDSLSTFTYSVTPDSSLILYTPEDRFHTWPIYFSIINPSVYSVALITGWQTTPGGIIGRSVYLKNKGMNSLK